jgi:tRNA (cytidine/uridine-2'-O-)-methyltransferase
MTFLENPLPAPRRGIERSAFGITLSVDRVTESAPRSGQVAVTGRRSPLPASERDLSIDTIAWHARPMTPTAAPIHVALYRPEIPPNTGNVIRLCANTGATLHLIRPLGFELDDRRLKRAGLDYHEWARVNVHEDLERCLEAAAPGSVYAFSTRGERSFFEAAFAPGDLLLFGPETRGLPDTVLGGIPPDQRLCIPMVPGSRSINLSNAVAVALFEAWRQLEFTA